MPGHAITRHVASGYHYQAGKIIASRGSFISFKIKKFVNTGTVSEEEKSLAQKLDEDIDKYIEGLPKRPYKDGWPEDKWQEEMEKHPFFMTKPPTENDELSPLVEGLQQLKYDESENTPDELANTYKDDGNFSFKCKKYREAIMNYSAGLKYNCSDDLKAILYNNRGAANFFLENYRSALSDSEKALESKPNYTKAEVRIAQCYYHLEKYESCVEICDKILSSGDNDTIATLKKKALSNKKIKERDLRKQEKSIHKETQMDKQLLEVIRSRNVKVMKPSENADVASAKNVTSISELKPCYEQLHLRHVRLEGDELVWPVVFLYPVYNIFDCIQEFRESSTFQDHLNEMLLEKPEWDTHGKYKPNTVNIYFKDEKNKNFKVSSNKTLKQSLQHKNFVIKDGVPLFYVLPQNSSEEKDFLNNE